MVIQPIDEFIDDYSPVEKRAFRDSAEHANDKKVAFYEKQEELSDMQVRDLLNKSEDGYQR